MTPSRAVWDRRRVLFLAAVRTPAGTTCLAGAVAAAWLPAGARG